MEMEVKEVWGIEEAARALFEEARKELYDLHDEDVQHCKMSQGRDVEVLARDCFRSPKVFVKLVIYRPIENLMMDLVVIPTDCGGYMCGTTVAYGDMEKMRAFIDRADTTKLVEDMKRLYNNVVAP